MSVSVTDLTRRLLSLCLAPFDLLGFSRSRFVYSNYTRLVHSTLLVNFQALASSLNMTVTDFMAPKRPKSTLQGCMADMQRRGLAFHFCPSGLNPLSLLLQSTKVSQCPRPPFWPRERPLLHDVSCSISPLLGHPRPRFLHPAATIIWAFRIPYFASRPRPRPRPPPFWYCLTDHLLRYGPPKFAPWFQSSRCH